MNKELTNEQIAQSLNNRIEFINSKRSTCINAALELSINDFISEQEYHVIASKIRLYYDTQIKASEDLARMIVVSLNNI